MDRIIIALLFLWFVPCNLYCQLSPGIHNYTLGEYKAGNQNWDLTRADNGKVYVANNKGLLEYDGLSWNFYQLPNKTTIRSVHACRNFIFTGSYEEFGFWKKDDFGRLQYRSLSSAIAGQISQNEEIWQIKEFNGVIIFRSFQNVYVYDFETVKQITTTATIISCDVVDDNLYISTLSGHIYIFKHDKLEPFYFNDILKDSKIVAIHSYNGKLLISTSLKGSFFLDQDVLRPTNFEIDEIIKKHQLNVFSILDNGKMVFGTIKDGVFVTNTNGKLTYHVSRENGLTNNTILGQFIDDRGCLWLGLDNGVSKVNLNEKNYFFNDISGKLGAVYDIIIYNGLIYMGSNTGLFRLDSQYKLHFIEGSQGQVWDLNIIDGQLFCGHNEGTYLVQGDRLKPISNFTGGWTIKKVPESSNTYIQGTYSGLVKFQKKNKKWKASHLGKTTIPSRFLVFENTHTAWVAHAYKGLYRVKFDENYNSIISVKSYLNHKDNSNYNVRVFNIKNRVAFKTNSGWYKYEPIQDSIIPYTLLNQKLGKDSYIISEVNTDRLALRTGDGFVSFKSFSDTAKDFVVSDKLFKDRYVVGYESVSRMSDSTYALNLDNGFMTIDGSKMSNRKLYKPILESVFVNEKPIAVADIANEEITFSHSSTLEIRLSSPKSTNYSIEYNLSGDSKQWLNTKNGHIRFNSLKNGTYQILFRVRDDKGQLSELSTLNIIVLPPWHKDTLGYMLYIVLLALTIVLCYILYKKKIQKEQRIIAIKYEREQQKLLKEKTLENEKRIVQLKNQSLKSEVNLKSKQLANTAMALVKKNEILQEIKNELMENKANFSNYYAFKKLLRKVDNSIVLKDQWELFEYNFNQVHEEFFDKLKEQHSNLKPKDLKICAYIKMNLSTKEIAPLMNISTRGVETHRYRLKKKMNLDNDISLMDYLLNLK